MPANVADILGLPQDRPKDEPVKVLKNPVPESEGMTAQGYVDHLLLAETLSVRASEPRRREWDRSWNLYNNVYDFSTKAAWQSKNSVPRINMAVRTAVFMVKKALIGPLRTFHVDGYGEFGKLAACYIDKLVQHHLDDANFVTNITDSLHAGLLSSLMVLKVYPVYEDDTEVKLFDPRSMPVSSMNGPIITRKFKRLKMRIDPVDPYHIHLDPSGGNRYKIQDMTMDLYSFKKLAEQPGSGYDMEVVKQIIESYAPQTSTDGDKSQDELRAGQMPDTKEPPSRKTVVLKEYWGDIWDKQGQLIAENCTYVIANNKYLVKKPIKNKLPGGDPYIVSPIVRKPFSVWHQGFVETVAGLQVMMTELLNLIIDANFFASAKAFEVDIDMVYDPNEFIDGIYPGKTFKKRGGGFSQSPMIREINIGNVAQQALPIYQALDREFGSGVGVNEFTMPGNRSSGSRTTATEVMAKDQSSSGFMEEVAKTIEEGVIVPLLDKVLHYMIEYQINFTDPYLTELLGADEAMKLEVLMGNPGFRMAMHKAPIKFRAKGLSTMVARFREFDKILMFGKTILQNPQTLQYIDMKKFLDKAVEAMGWYPTDILLDREIPKQAPMPQFPSMPLPQMPIGAMGGDFLGQSASNGLSQVGGY